MSGGCKDDIGRAEDSRAARPAPSAPRHPVLLSRVNSNRVSSTNANPAEMFLVLVQSGQMFCDMETVSDWLTVVMEASDWSDMFVPGQHYHSSY